MTQIYCVYRVFGKVPSTQIYDTFGIRREKIRAYNCAVIHVILLRNSVVKSLL